MRTIDAVYILILFILLAIYISVIEKDNRDLINKNNRIQMEQIQKSIETQTRFINALNGAVRVK